MNFKVKHSFRKVFRLNKNNGHKNNGQAEHQKELDKKLVYSLSKSRIPSFGQLKHIRHFLNPLEIWLLRISFVIILLSIITGGTFFYFNNLQVVPVPGGTYVEGLIGSPKYINPLYSSVSDVDNDLSRLVYSSFYKRGKNGELVSDLAVSYEISEDNLNYTFEIRTDALWNDGSPLTVDDVIFTFLAIKDSQYKSPLRNSFIGVDIEKIDQSKLKFILSDPYAAFLELLTFGIMPAELWSQVPPESATLAELNLKPIGSGPYKFEELVKDKSGSVKEYNLVINEDYYGSKPLINLSFRIYTEFFEAITALNDNTIDGLSYLPQEYKADILTPKVYNYHKLYLPQMTLVFFNSDNNEALKEKEIRQALALALNREEMIGSIMAGGAYVVHSPILASSFAYHDGVKKYDYSAEAAIELLNGNNWEIVDITEEQFRQAGENLNSEDEKTRTDSEKIVRMGAGTWRQKEGNFLTINLKTVERSENEVVVNAIKEDWERVGVKTIVETLPLARIQGDVIKPRNFDALFYGQVVGADPDPYAFWHSSQTGENGYNISNFVNKEVDQLLEDARLSSDQNARQEKYIAFQDIIAEEVPAIFMYSPVYTYIQSNTVKGFDVTTILVPRDRFANIEEWYIKTGKKLVWGKGEE